MSDWTISREQQQEIARQIGMMNILAISGGRIYALPDGIMLPVGNGYSVEVRLTPVDEYTVERVFTRTKVIDHVPHKVKHSHGMRERVFCDEVGETAYKASCYRNDDAEYWPEALEVRR